MSIKENYNMLNNTVVESETEIKVKTELQPDDWLCLRCSKKITEDKEKFFFENQCEFQFTNPDGFIFDIITFRTAEGCREEGEPTLAFTWFRDHSWSFALCSRCSLHLGWKYSGRFSFFGLIRSRIVKGLALYN